MEKQQAASLIKQVVDSYRGTLQEHQLLQQAMEVAGLLQMISGLEDIKEAEPKK